MIKVTGGQPVDWSAWGGLWTPCAGSVTPWNTRLGGEEVRGAGDSSVNPQLGLLFLEQAASSL
jgi:hypothetical protein